MWKLKIGEGNGEDPYLFSSNNFVGRQTWEFDPNAGTPEERAAIVEARRSFYDDRFRVKASSDLLWRMQVSSYSLEIIFSFSFIFYIDLLNGIPYT